MELGILNRKEGAYSREGELIGERYLIERELIIERGSLLELGILNRKEGAYSREGELIGERYLIERELIIERGELTGEILNT